MPTVSRAILAAAAVALVGGVADGQTVTDRTSDYDVSFSTPTFSNAAAAYTVTLDFPAQAPFSEPFKVTVANNAQGVMFSDSGGVTYAPTATSPTVYNGTLAGDGDAGSVSYGYSTAATYGGSHVLTLGQSGSLATLTFLGGGGENGFSNFPFAINVTLPGNWSMSGTSTGDHQYLDVASGFTLTSDFVYNAVTNTTLVSATDPDFQSGGATALNFVLHGAAVPEPASWAIMLLGVALAGAAMRRRGASRVHPERISSS